MTELPPHFQAIRSEVINKGHTVFVCDGEIVYAGPIGGAPDMTKDVEVYLHPEDFERLKTVTIKHRH